MIDANVLIQAPIRDTLLRSAEDGLLVPYWGPTILEEVSRNLPKLLTRYPDATQRVEVLVRQMNRAFPRALVSDDSSVVPPLAIASAQINQRDRHVLAAAVHAGAGAIVTYNRRHFPSAALTPRQIRPMTPDEFLQRLFTREPVALVTLLQNQGIDLHPPRSLDSILKRLEQDVPRFVNRVREYIT